MTFAHKVVMRINEITHLISSNSAFHVAGAQPTVAIIILITVPSKLSCSRRWEGGHFKILV